MTILSSLNRFSKFFHWNILQKICSKAVIIHHTLRVLPHYLVKPKERCIRWGPGSPNRNINVGKQAINDKLQNSVAKHSRCNEIINNHITKGLLLCLPVKTFIRSCEYLAELQARRWLSRALRAPGHHTSKR